MGFLRLFLALSVVVGHAKYFVPTQTTVFGFNGMGSWYAVNFFFIISGFYMAMILNGKYKDIQFSTFYKSRALRLFPVYYVGLLLGLWVSFDSVVDAYSNLTPSSQFFYVFQHLFLFGQDLTSSVLCLETIQASCIDFPHELINPPSWSLAIEIGFYLCAPFILKDIRKTVCFFIVGCIYLVSLNFLSFPVNVIDIFRSTEFYGFSYNFYGASFIFFGAGALSYHLSKANFRPQYLLTLVLIWLLSFTHTPMTFWHILFISIAIPAIFKATANSRLDRITGELSYPVFILHVPVLHALIPYMDSHPKLFQYFSLGSWASVAAGIIGLALHFTIENRVNKFRSSTEFLAPTPAPSRSIYLKKIAPLLVSLYLLLPLLMSAYIYVAQNFHETTFAGTPLNVTNNEWLKGIGKGQPGLILVASEDTIDSYKKNNLLKFSSGEIRKIVEVTSQKRGQNHLVIVRLTGQNPLNGKIVGFPNKVYFVERFSLF